jgi:hypothetical protein
MPVSGTLYQEVVQRLGPLMAPAGLGQPAVRRLAVLITGLIAAQSGVLARIAAAVYTLELTQAQAPEHVERGLRRTLNDARLTPTACYHAELAELLDWRGLVQGSRRVVLAVDESSHTDAYHLLRVSLPYWGGAVVLAWAVWEQNVAQPAGHYWAQMDQVLAQVAALLPPGLEVVVVADRAYDIAPFVDRLHARGWHWVIRAKTESSLRFRDARGREHALRALARQHLPGPGRRWRTRGQVFKKAGWREASVVGVWAAGTQERLVVLTDLRPRWAVLRVYARRFWIEPGFRTDKSHGWQWERSQVQGVAHQARLLLAMAWASVLMLALGVAEAQRRLAHLAHRRPRGPRPGRPRHARQSLFTLGLRAVGPWLYGGVGHAFPWHLPDLEAPSWLDRWHQAQALPFIFGQTVRP